MGKEKKFRAEEASRKSGVEEARTRKLSKRWLLSGNLLNWNIPLPFPFHRVSEWKVWTSSPSIVASPVKASLNPNLEWD